ncbi:MULTISPECIES: glycogen debranching protein GlgX [unclassified Paenibacillus]|uniref:glycogen debranching protein GlgX n=1 Tax=unclassified Paenibacillus TaxID=185978 RepID=UPI001AE745B2|nr:MULTISPECIES: glycogen debranching protein GlgX [unclassified Paenibacillus]MBP1157316.1 glycogen operon protein [Paenibacillus sp. PvP091]MBP1171945.1 glycogen operon protein [Paenibacillus sp. PvR098]MBP2438326.1 glycogen operon protein [Paenibacillus sp. PvP052]
MAFTIDTYVGSLSVYAGRPHPLGATPDQNGVNFSLFSSHATSVELLLFEGPQSVEPFLTVPFYPIENKTFHFWHLYIKGAKPGMYYAYRVDGPFDPKQGQRFNKNKVLIDPYAKGNSNVLWNRVDACTPEDNLTTSMRSAIIDVADYDWEGDKPINRPMSETVIYEMHPGGFTKSPTSEVDHPGSFRGIIEKIPYLKDLGITAVELMPVFEFDDKEVLRMSPENGEILMNYWGYSTVSYFAPHRAYCVDSEATEHINEFRDMVKALHKAGIEVILDVVFNHTNEGNHMGPTLNFKGLDNSTYYYLSENKEFYMDYSGCGNTVNCNHPIVEKMIVECLEFWVQEMHVDGFRFDEGSIMTRGEDGRPMVHPPVVWHIELSETLSDTKIIAEAWDAAGLYQIGHFPGYRWAEWNGRFRDDIRRFAKGDPGIVGEAASRIAGSADIYQSSGHLPINSINFITCHDGFTLNDLVSYNGKHNEANGEWNQDGINDNLSWNCGYEGETNDREIEGLRNRQVKNMASFLLLSQGVPMILAGDEIRRTQHGNNNAYCQDNEISWFDWRLTEKNQDIYRFFKEMIAFRKRHPVLHRRRFFNGELNDRGLQDMMWHGCKLFSPGWNDPESRVLSFTLGGLNHDTDIHVILNMDYRDLDFELPSISNRSWYRVADTSLAAPQDIVSDGQEVQFNGSVYPAAGRSVAVFMSK